MNCRAGLSLLLGILLASLPKTFSATVDDRESVYNVTVIIVDDVKESTFTIKLKARPISMNTLVCSLYDPKYEVNYLKTSNNNSSHCNNDEQHLKADSSYVGNFEVKFNKAIVEGLTVSSGTSLKQLSFYRIIANHLFLGIDIRDKNEGTYTMTEESVYGKCEADVKIVRTLRFDGKENTGSKGTPHQTVSIKRTRNLETCYPVPSLLLFDSFFYHPMMASVHYDIKSSVSRFIVSDSTFTSYTTEDIAVYSLERGGITTMLHVRTTVTQHSYAHSADPLPRIIDPVSVELPFVDGFNPAERNNTSTTKKLEP